MNILLLLLLTALMLCGQELAMGFSLQHSLRNALAKRQAQLEDASSSSSPTASPSLSSSSPTASPSIFSNPEPPATQEEVAPTECEYVSATQACRAGFALTSFGTPQVRCCPVTVAATSRALNSTGLVSTVLGSGRSRGVYSTGFLTKAFPTIGADNLFEVDLHYESVLNLRTFGCNEMNVLLDHEDSEIPEMRCMKRHEVIQAVWMFTRIDMASIRFAITCCQLEQQQQ